MSFIARSSGTLKQIARTLVEPVSANVDLRRQEFVLNTLLVGALILSVTGLMRVCVDVVLYGPTYHGASPAVVGGVALFLVGLYGLSRSGRARLASYVFVGCFTAIGAGIVYTWGVNLPTGSLVLVMVLVMSSILVGTRFSFVMTGVVAAILLTLGYLEVNGVTHPNFYWMHEGTRVSDAVGYVFILGIITLVSWLSNREVSRSLQRALASEAALEKQRNLLEVRVEERTRELKQAQLEKILQLYRFADFGRISSSFLHDIINPLTAVSLNLEQLSNKRRSELLGQAIAGIKHIEDFAMAARKQVQGHNDPTVFKPGPELREVARILEGKARQLRVKVMCEVDDDVLLYGSPIKLHQIASNLLVNALDAYAEVKGGRREAVMRLEKRGKGLVLTVSDWGTGISAEHLPQIFEPFFTTKPSDKGTGIGLLIVKRIVEEDFGGSIEVVSDPKTGTVFTVTLPAAPK